MPVVYTYMDDFGRWVARAVERRALAAPGARRPRASVPTQPEAGSRIDDSGIIARPTGPWTHGEAES